MKKTLLILACILSVVFIIASVRTANSSEENNSSVMPMAQNEEKEPLYIIKTYNNTIGVFKYNESTPYLTLDEVMLNSLSEYDQKLLKSGIKVYSQEDLLSLIEDYDS